jgi:hypothetical protein
MSEFPMTGHMAVKLKTSEAVHHEFVTKEKFKNSVRS